MGVYNGDFPTLVRFGFVSERGSFIFSGVGGERGEKRIVKKNERNRFGNG